MFLRGVCNSDSKTWVCWVVLLARQPSVWLSHGTYLCILQRRVCFSELGSSVAAEGNVAEICNQELLEKLALSPMLTLPSC